MNVKINITGLVEIKDIFSPKTTHPVIIKSLASIGNQVNQKLRSHINNFYSIRSSIDTVRLNKSSYVTKTGTNLLSFGLEYEHVPVDLSKYDYTWKNIGTHPTRFEHKVAIKKGDFKAIPGKYGNKGWTARTADGKLSRPWKDAQRRGARTGYRGGAQMFERVGRGRKPLTLLIGPSLAILITSSLNRDKEIIDYLENIPNFFLNDLVRELKL